MGSWEKLSNENGIEISRKVNAAYTAFKLSDSEILLKGKYNHQNQKEVEASFSTPLFSKFGTETTLTAEEAALQHRGSIRSRIKLTEKMSENNVLEQILIPGAIEYGLKSNYFPLKDGENPFTRKEGPFLRGFNFYSFTNIFDNVWVAYINPLTCDIWVSNNNRLVNWKWIEYSKINKEMDFVPWPLHANELNWFNLLCETSAYFSNILKNFPVNKK